jgi:peptidoglycan-N-acetylmuramic acid deacetylase
VTVPPPSSAPATPPVGEYIGTLYTRDFLETLPSESTGYGAGKHVDSKNRPTYAISLDKQYEKYDAHFICPDDGKVYLTYNITYEHEGLVQKTLDILKEKNVQCVIFIDQHFAKNYPKMVQQILNDGHILANHCTTHPDLPTLSIDKIVNQIMDIHNYVKATYNYEMKFFRPPSGYFSEQVWAIAHSLGYRSYNWSFTYLDWDTDNQPDPAETLQKMIDALHSGAIYQFHAISSTNAAVLEDFIDATRNAGFEFALLP